MSSLSKERTLLFKTPLLASSSSSLSSSCLLEVNLASFSVVCSLTICYRVNNLGWIIAVDEIYDWEDAHVSQHVCVCAAAAAAAVAAAAPRFVGTHTFWKPNVLWMRNIKNLAVEPVLIWREIAAERKQKRFIRSCCITVPWISLVVFGTFMGLCFHFQQWISQRDMFGCLVSSSRRSTLLL